MMKISRALAALGLVCAVGGAQAALVGRDINGNAVAGDAANSVFLYDTVLNVTWLRNANANGVMNWTQANTWAANLVVGAYVDWRLPTMAANPNATGSYAGGTDYYYNVRTKSGNATQYEAGQTVYSEMAHLWYSTLGNKAYCDPVGSSDSYCNGPQAGWGLTNTGDFQNLQSAYYWYGLEYAPDTSRAWSFDTAVGGQFGRNTDAGGVYALAVRPGDVLATPIPAAAWLMLSGIGALGAAAKRRKPLAVQS